MPSRAHEEARRAHDTFGDFFGHTVGQILAGNRRDRLQVNNREGLGALVVQAWLDDQLDDQDIRRVTTVSEVQGGGLVTVGHTHGGGLLHVWPPRVWRRPTRNASDIEAENAYGALKGVDVPVKWDDESREQLRLTAILIEAAAAGPEDDALRDPEVFRQGVLPFVGGRRLQGPLATYDPILTAVLRERVERFY
jgi:hypothetical protein